MRQISLVQPSSVNWDGIANVLQYHHHSHNLQWDYVNKQNKSSGTENEEGWG